jgi:hypothetical protein
LFEALLISGHEVPPKYHEGMRDSTQHDHREREGYELGIFFENIGSEVKLERKPDRIQDFLEIYRQTENMGTHTHLNYDLVEHCSQIFGRNSLSFFICSCVI